MKKKTATLITICAAAITVNSYCEETENNNNDTILSQTANSITVAFSNRTATIVENSPELEFD